MKKKKEKRICYQLMHFRTQLQRMFDFIRYINILKKKEKRYEYV